MLKRIFNKLLKVTVGRVNLVLGQVFFGNGSGFVENIVGLGLVYYARRKKPKSEPQPLHLSTKLDEMKARGFVFVESSGDNGAIVSLQRRFNLWCDKNKEKISQYRLQCSSVGQGSEFFNDFPELLNLLNGEVSELLKGYYRSDFEVLNVHIYRTFMPEQRAMLEDGSAYGSTLCWHSDGSTTDTLKVFFLLNDLKVDGGPMLVLNKSHSRTIFARHIPFILEKHGTPNKTEFNKFDGAYYGAKGRCMIVDTNRCLHRASIPEAMPRDMVCFYIGVDIGQNNSAFHNSGREPYSGFMRLLNL